MLQNVKDRLVLRLPHETMLFLRAEAEKKYIAMEELACCLLTKTAIEQLEFNPDAQELIKKVKEGN